MLLKKSHFWWFKESMCSTKRKTLAGFWLVSLWLISLYAVLHLSDRSGNRVDVEVSSDVVDTKRVVQMDYLCPPHITIALDMGRLGNKFFEFLAARAMADVMDSVVYLTPSFAEIYDKYFVGRKTPVVDWTIWKNRCGLKESDFVTLNFNYMPDLQPPQNYTPYNQVLGYPVDISAATWETIFAQKFQIAQEFQWKPDIKASVDKQLENIRSNHSTSTVVSIHVRRTDYYVYLVSFYGAFHTANSSYYNNAMDYFRKKYTRPVFLVFSDDLAWCKENLVGPDILYPGNGNENDPGYDLALMSLSDHIILSYGTFGMMAAYFNRGEVISAYNFTSKPEKMVENLKTIRSLNWIWMSV